MSTPLDAPAAMRLPKPLTALVGREAEIAEASELLGGEDVRLLTLTGPGGVGKTRLALAVAEQLTGVFANGVWFVGLAPVTDPELIGSAVAQVLGLYDAGSDPLVERLKAFLGRKQLLLVLDNFEQVVEAAPLLVTLLEVCPGLKALVTSRTRLRVSGEHEQVVAPLAVTVTSDSTATTGLREPEAVRLFVDRARAVQASFALTAENAATLTQICHRLDGLPLAIELAAARIKVLPPPALLARLERRLPLLTGGGRDRPARQQTMRGTVAWSFQLLTAAEQALFRRLSVFAGGCTLEAGEAVASGTGDGETEAFEGISALADSSLLREEPGAGGEPRYVMLETVREFGLEQLSVSAEVESMSRRHAGYFADFADSVAAPILNVPNPELDFRRIDADHDNLRAALAWAVWSGDHALLLRLVSALRWYWHMTGQLTEGRAWAERAVTMTATAAMIQRAAALWEAGWFARHQGDVNHAEALGNESLRLYRELGDDIGVARALNLLGLAAEDRGEFDRSRALHQEAVDLLVPMDVFSWTADALRHLGWSSYLCGDVTQAERHWEDALARYRIEGDQYGPALVRSDLAIVALKRGQPRRAAILYQDRLAVTWDALGLRWGLEELAMIALASGQHARAARLYGAAETTRERLGIAVVPNLVPHYEQTIAAMTTVLGQTAFDAAWAEGRRMSADEARAEAALVAHEAPEVSSAQTVSVSSPYGLTPRELDVLRLLIEGRSDKEIGAALFLSHRTVMRHVTGILTKLGVDNRTAATRYAVRHGLV